MSEPLTPTEEREELRPGQHYDTRLPELSRWQRMQVPIIGWAGYWLLRTLCPTLRIESLGQQHERRVYAGGRRVIFAFWHRGIIPIVWWTRNRGIVVMNSTNFDGQWTRRVIERLGYGTAQGSSTRGGLRGLAVMAKRLEQGRDVAFTIDGPRGPRFVAKPGPSMLARQSGCPIIAFSVGMERAHTFENTWDKFQMPYPGSRAVIAYAPPIEVPVDANREMLESKHAEMQGALERSRRLAESWFSMSEEDRNQHSAEWNA